MLGYWSQSITKLWYTHAYESTSYFGASSSRQGAMGDSKASSRGSSVQGEAEWAVRSAQGGKHPGGHQRTWSRTERFLNMTVVARRARREGERCSFFVAGIEARGIGGSKIGCM